MKILILWHVEKANSGFQIQNYWSISICSEQYTHILHRGLTGLRESNHLITNIVFRDQIFFCNKSGDGIRNTKKQRVVEMIKSKIYLDENVIEREWLTKYFSEICSFFVWNISYEPSKIKRIELCNKSNLKHHIMYGSNKLST